MDAVLRYEFDRLGYLVLPGFLSASEVAALSEAIDWLEEHAAENVTKPPRKAGTLYPSDWHQNPDYGYHAISMPSPDGSRGAGQTMIVEDFFNAHPAFDLLVDHGPTMDVISTIVQGPARINNSELRFRYPANSTGQHMGGPIDHKYRYSFNGHGIDAMMVRFIYFVHDVTNEQGAFCVVPATHKSNYHSPYHGASVDEEPGMLGLDVKAGDAVIFTENLRHGGLTNHSDQTRKTLHVGYGPIWMYSQNDATRDEPQYITEQTLARYTPEQRDLFLIDWPRIRERMLRRYHEEHEAHEAHEAHEEALTAS
jgi:hypothetical protein